MNLDKNITITAETPIRDLYKAGIVPEWMYRECDLHGMYEAENILCEWDWEDGWDLGDGYNKEQREILANIRTLIHNALGY